MIGVKNGSQDSWLMARMRRFYYWLVAKLSSDVELVHNFTGFGLYDREVVEQFRATDEQYPYFRGLVSDFGYARAEIQYVQPARKHGNTKNNFFTLYDMAMLGITSHSKVPLRLATMAGFAMSILSLLVALAYLVLKLAWWDTFDLGLAPLVIGVYFLGAVQLFFIGMLGEYIGSIHTQVHKRPLVVEKERINFDRPESGRLAGPDDRIDALAVVEQAFVADLREKDRVAVEGSSPEPRMHAVRKLRLPTVPPVERDRGRVTRYRPAVAGPRTPDSFGLEQQVPSLTGVLGSDMVDPTR